MVQETNNTALVAVAFTAEQQEILNNMAAYGKRLQELAFNSVGKWVAAGYADGKQGVANMYCYCGMGKGYKGAPLVPANGNAVVFASREAAQRRASQLKYQNGRGERIRLHFEGKPDPEMITKLKQAAFKWSPRNMAWQRQLTSNALYATKRLLGVEQL